MHISCSSSAPEMRSRSPARSRRQARGRAAAAQTAPSAGSPCPRRLTTSNSASWRGRARWRARSRGSASSMPALRRRAGSQAQALRGDDRVSDYVDPDLRLGYAADDARGFARCCCARKAALFRRSGQDARRSRGHARERRRGAGLARRIRHRARRRDGPDRGARVTDEKQNSSTVPDFAFAVAK